MCLLWRGFHTLIKNASFPTPIDVGSHNPSPLGPVFSLAHCLVSTPFRCSASSLAHRPMSIPLQCSTSSLAHCPMFSSNTICNSPSPLLADIVLFGLFPSVHPLSVLSILTGTLLDIHRPSMLNILTSPLSHVWL